MQQLLIIPFWPPRVTHIKLRIHSGFFRFKLKEFGVTYRKKIFAHQEKLLIRKFDEKQQLTKRSKELHTSQQLLISGSPKNKIE
jgi:hypothetical protein